LVLGVLLVLGWVLVFDRLTTVKVAQPIWQAWLVIGLAIFAAAAYLVAREKGRSIVWVGAVFFVAPLLLVLLLMPYHAGRRAAIDDAARG
jgi:hypothetical protein